jgi:hypothetical protein
MAYPRCYNQECTSWSKNSVISACDNGFVVLYCIRVVCALHRAESPTNSVDAFLHLFPITVLPAVFPKSPLERRVGGEFREERRGVE